jgi:GDSL-like Lipase/Acylhydrolase family
VLVSRLFTLALSLALLVGTLGGRPIPLRHNETLPLDYVENRVAVISDSYTTGTDEGGMGPKNWTTIAWQTLGSEKVPVTADVQAEGGAGYGTRGNHGSVFEDLTTKAVRPDDALVVFFGSRNDKDVDPARLSVLIYGTFQLARRTAPSAQFLVIGPAWPTADPPVEILRIRDALAYHARLTGAVFVDPIAAGWFVGRPDLIGADGVHPTDAGHTYMADKIAPLIGSGLTRRI